MDFEQLSRVTGVAIHTLRRYRHLGLFNNLDSAAGFTDAHVCTIKLVRLATRTGMSLRDVLGVIHAVNHGDNARLLNAINRLRTQGASLHEGERKRWFTTLAHELDGMMAVE